MPPLQPVEPQRLYRQIAGQLRTLISQGELAVGSRLPAERDLARQLRSLRAEIVALRQDLAMNRSASDGSSMKRGDVDGAAEDETWS